MKTGIVVITYNLDCRIFILQVEAIKKYCKDNDFTIEIIDNSTDAGRAAGIKHHARVQEVNYTKFNSTTKDPSRSHSFAASLAYRRFMDIYDHVLFLDHDAIPVKPFSVSEMLNGKIVGGILAGSKLNYFWPGCVVFDNTKIYKELVDFSPDNNLGLDTGGGLRRLKEKYGDEGCEYFDEVGWHNEAMQTHKDYYFYMMIYKETFMHFIAGSDWSGKERHEERMNTLIDIATEKMKASDI